MRWSRFLGTLKLPRTVLVGVLLGALSGWYSATITQGLAPVSMVFFSLLKMCALPIVITAVLLSFARLWHGSGSARYLPHVGVVFLAGIAILGTTGAIFGIELGRLLSKDAQTVTALSEMMGKTSRPIEVGPTGVISFLLNIIPKNVFRALSEGEILGTLLFVILLGTAIGANRKGSVSALVESIETLNEAFFRIVSWVTYLLPLAMCSLVAHTVATLGAGGFSVFGKLVTAIALGCVVVFSVQVVITKILLRSRWISVYRRLREPALVALSSSSSLATLPSLEMSLAREGAIPKPILDLVLPIAITFCQHGSVFFYTFAVAFVTRMYGLPVGPAEIFIIVLGSYFHSLAAAGMPAVASVGFIVTIFRPLGMPIETFEVVLVAVMPLVDPLLTLVNVSGQVVSSSLVHRLATRPQAETSISDDSDPALPTI